MKYELPVLLVPFHAMIQGFEHESAVDFGERSSYWVYLTPGLCVESDGLHTIHETSLRRCAYLLRKFVQRCECEACL